MKKLILTFFVLIGLSSLGFAQEASQIATTKGAKELSASKASGNFEFTLPGNLTADQVEKNSTYYTHYFTVSFDANSHKATIEMMENTSKNRYVIARFLTACGISHLEVDDNNIELYDFIDDYLK